MKIRNTFGIFLAVLGGLCACASTVTARPESPKTASKPVVVAPIEKPKAAPEPECADYEMPENSRLRLDLEPLEWDKQTFEYFDSSEPQARFLLELEKPAGVAVSIRFLGSSAFVGRAILYDGEGALKAEVELSGDNATLGPALFDKGPVYLAIERCSGCAEMGLFAAYENSVTN